MQTQRGFIGLSILIAIVLGLIVVGGGAYFLMQQNSVPQTNTQTNYYTIQDIEASKSTQKNLCAGGPFETGFKPEETAFYACPSYYKHNTGELAVVVGAQIVRADGKDYEAVIIFGDGEEETVAHWKPTFFNEQLSHVYARPGEYDASLVLVPRSSLNADVLSFKKKVQDLNTLILIKKIHITIEQSGSMSIEQ
ncbi:MAG: hypothetical protein Q7S26_02820 [bacterium]|nr:hypothetical protein [bacterium]